LASATERGTGGLYAARSILRRPGAASSLRGSTLMSYLAAFVVIALSAVAAAVSSRLVGAKIKLDERQRHHEVGGAVFLQIGVLISVLIAFVFSQVWGEYRTAAMAINGECGALHGAAMLSHALPGDVGQPVDRAIAVYARTVVNTEWPMMTQRRRSPEATLAFEAIIQSAANLNVTRAVEVSDQGQIVSLLAQAHAYRETRTFQLSEGIPSFIWVMLIGISLTLIGFVVFAGLEDPGHMILAAAFSACMALVLVLVRMLDFPFEGALALPNTDFVKMLAQVSALASGQP